MKRLKLTLKLILLFSLLWSACTEVIEFDARRAGRQLVVDASIVAGPGPFNIYLGRTSSTVRKTIPEDGAKISIFDEQGKVGNYLAMGEGQYQIAKGIFEAMVGSTYHLQIELINGEKYESERATIPAVYGKLDSLSFSFGEIRELNEYGNSVIVPVVHALADLQVYPSGGESRFFRFDVEGVYRLSPTDFPDPFQVIPPACYIYTRPDLSTFKLLVASRDKEANLQDIEVASDRIDFRYDEKYYFNVYMRNITEGAYTFWNRVDQSLSSVGTIFDTPPAPIQGNIFNVNDADEQVLGYFNAMSSDTIRAFLLPEDLPYIPYYECRYRPGKLEYPGRCLDCLSIPGSTFEKPDYF